MQKITQLLQDNYDQREQIRSLREQIPDDDQVVLDPEQAERLQEIGALSEDGEVQADEVEERLSEGEEAQQELQALKRKEKRREVYEATGLNAEAAEDILPSGVEYETETVETDDGEETKAFVKTDNGRKEVGEYVEENFSEPIQKALYAEGGEEGGSGEEDTTSSTSVPQQTPAGEDNPSGGEPDEEEIQQEKRSQVDYSI